jgi:hypothetical protein
MSGSDSSSEPIGEERLTLRPEALEWVDVEEEIVVLDTERSVYLATNPSGALLWRMLTDGTTQQDLVAALVEAFEITPERAEHDVEVFVDRLKGLGLLAGRDG